MASLLISDLNVLEDVSHEEMTRLEGGAAAVAAAAANPSYATAASGSTTLGNARAFAFSDSFGRPVSEVFIP